VTVRLAARGEDGTPLQWETRLDPAEAVEDDAIARHAGLPKKKLAAAARKLFKDDPRAETLLATLIALHLLAPTEATDPARRAAADKARAYLDHLDDIAKTLLPAARQWCRDRLAAGHPPPALPQRTARRRECGRTWPGLRQGRLQQPQVANAFGAAIAGDLKGVQLEHVLDVEELWRLGSHLASFLSVSS